MPGVNPGNSAPTPGGASGLGRPPPGGIFKIHQLHRLPSRVTQPIFDAMKYRRFGRTELAMPVISCGGMRYQFKWQDADPGKSRPTTRPTSKPPFTARSNWASTTSRPPAATALPKCSWAASCPRCRATKSSSKPRLRRRRTAQEFLEIFETSMKYLRLDHVDLLALHGINNRELLDWSLKKDGCLAAARRLQKDGPRAVHRVFHARDDRHHPGGGQHRRVRLLSTSTGISSMT